MSLCQNQDSTKKRDRAVALRTCRGPRTHFFPLLRSFFWLLKKRSPSSRSWLKKQRQDCLPCQGRHWACRGADRHFTGTSELRLFTGVACGKKTKKRLWIPLFSLLCCPKENQSKNMPFEALFYMKNKQTPLQWETSDLKQDSVKAPSSPVPWGEALNLYIPLSRSPNSLSWLFPFYLSCTNDILWASF